MNMAVSIHEKLSRKGALQHCGSHKDSPDFFNLLLQQKVAQAPALIDCARWITNAESVEDAGANALFEAADVNR